MCFVSETAANTECLASLRAVSGGLNTSASVDGISENQPARATNVETLGTLSGGLYPIATSWEDGILIASGGKLQYFNGENLTTIENSPVSNCVCIQAGRVPVTDEKNLYLSGVLLSICAVSDSVFVLGRNEMQTIRMTNDYGNMKPQNVSTLIEREIKTLPENTLLRFVPKLNQIWAISETVALIYDLVTQSWFKRQFNSQFLDVVAAKDEIFIIKHDRISKLEEELTDGEILIVKLSLGEHGSSTRRRLIHPTVLARRSRADVSKQRLLPAGKDTWLITWEVAASGI